MKSILPEVSNTHITRRWVPWGWDWNISIA